MPLHRPAGGNRAAFAFSLGPDANAMQASAINKPKPSTSAGVRARTPARDLSNTKHRMSTEGHKPKQERPGHHSSRVGFLTPVVFFRDLGPRQDSKETSDQSLVERSKPRIQTTPLEFKPSQTTRLRFQLLRADCPVGQSQRVPNTSTLSI